MCDKSDVEQRLTFTIEGGRVRYSVDELTGGKRRRVAMFQSQLFGGQPAAIVASKRGNEIRLSVIMQDDETTWRLVDKSIVCSEEGAFEKVAVVVSAWADSVNNALEAPAMFVQKSGAYVVAHSDGLSISVEAQGEGEPDYVKLTSFRSKSESFSYGVTQRIYCAPSTPYQHLYDPTGPVYGYSPTDPAPGYPQTSPERVYN